MPQVGKSPVLFPMRLLDFLIRLILPAPTMALWSTQPLTEMSTRNLPGGKERPARRADNLTAICDPIVYRAWEPQCLTTLRDSTVCYRDSFTFLLRILKFKFVAVSHIEFQQNQMHILYIRQYKHRRAYFFISRHPRPRDFPFFYATRH
jgi:hypothetical protein